MGPPFLFFWVLDHPIAVDLECGFDCLRVEWDFCLDSGGLSPVPVLRCSGPARIFRSRWGGSPLPAGIAISLKNVARFETSRENLRGLPLQ